MNDADKIARGNAAKRIVEDKVFQDCFEELERQLFQKFKSPGLPEDDMTRLWLSVQMLGKIKSWFDGVVANGEIAEFQLKKEQSGK